MKSFKQRSLLSLFFVVLADMIGFGFIIPLLPYYAEHFGASDTLIGLLGATYPLGQIFAAPLIGRLSDKFGRKKALILSVGGTAASLLILGFAKTLGMIFLSRLLDGLTGGNITVAQSYISDLTDERSRARSLGLIGAAFGLGFIIGPAFGGYLSRFGLSVPAFVATGIATANLIMIATLLPESRPADPRKVPFTFSELKKTMGQNLVRTLLVVKFFYSIAFTMFESGFALFSMRKLALNVTSTSFILAHVGILVAFTQGFLIRIVSKRFDETDLLKLSLPLNFVFLSFYSLSSRLPVLLLIISPLSVTSALSSVSITSMVTKVVPKEKVGGTLGIFNSVDGLTRIVSPILSGLVIQNFGPSIKGPIEGIFLFISTLAFLYYLSGSSTNSSL